jgi:sugar phosphate isomerase/epimerase
MSAGGTQIALHTRTVLHTNVATDVRVARSAGFDAIELWIPKLARYLDAGFSPDDLRAQLGSLRVTMLDTLLPIESRDTATRAQLRADCARMAAVAEQLGCPAIQVVALEGFASDDAAGRRAEMVSALTELAEIAAPHGVRLALEPVTFSPFRELSEAVDVVREVGVDRAGLCLDTWHLWTSGTPWDEVAALDAGLIAAVHLSDTQARSGPTWRDQDRTALPGEGVLPLREGIAAIRATGYAGAWGVEMLSERHWEWDPDVLASAILERARGLLDAERPPVRR